ncbi:NAD(P)H-binding protein [soil metagenome]
MHLMGTHGVRCLVTGSTGYIGSRLIPELINRGLNVRAMARTPKKLDDVPWRADVEVAEGDLTDPDTLVEAFDGVDVVYYLAHAMGTSDDFVAAEREAAENVVAAAKKAGVGRIVYLSGLHPSGAELSRHLQSRTAVGDILIDSGIETIVLQAGVVIGSGSASFEMIRHLTDRLPVMTTPKWVHNKIQPIAVRDVLHYLAEAATAIVPAARTWDIGGPDVLEYGDMMQVYAEVAGLRRRRILVLPFLTPTIASWWVGHVTPIPAGLARPLVESLHCDAVAGEQDIDAHISAPSDGKTPYRRSVELAIDHINRGQFESSWASNTPAEPLPSDPDWSGEIVYSDSVSTTTSTSPDQVFDAMVHANGRRWHVQSSEPNSTVRLRDWGRLPGDAWMDMRVSARAGGGAEFEQHVILCPRGLAGRLYAVTVWPVRRIMLRRRVNRLLA